MSEVRHLYAELLDITRPWSRHDLILSNRERATAIGQRLYEIGGEQLMQMAYYHATARNPAASILSLCWDRIGEWRW